MKNIKIGGIYEHFKGHEVEVVAIALHSETLEEMAVYRHLKEGDMGAAAKDVFGECGTCGV